MFETIAAESRRLINETYTAFVQSFMGTPARPDVDSLEGLTAAIVVDQERMGANARSTVGTATDANAMLRIIFSRLGEPHIGGPQAFSFNVPAGTRRPGRSSSSGASGKTESATISDQRRHVPALRGHGPVTDVDLTRSFDENQVAQRGRDHGPELQHGRLVRPDLRRLRVLRHGQADRASSPRSELQRPAPRSRRRSRSRASTSPTRG